MSGRAIPLTLGALTLLGALFVFPTRSDADYVLVDGITYAHQVELVLGGKQPFGSLLLANHLLFHVLAYGIAALLSALHVPDPGFVAGRILAAAGAALTVFVVARLARGRPLIGLLCAGIVLASRGFILEAVTGETLLPSIACALLALDLATREKPHTAGAAVALGLALLLRQDAILLAPGIAFGAALATDRGGRWRRVVCLLAPTAVGVVLVYAVAWQLNTWTSNASEFLLGLGARGSWSIVTQLGLDPAKTHLSSLGWALVGRHAEMGAARWWVGPAWLAGLAIAGLLWRGTGRCGPFAWGALACVVPRIPFFLWFEPENWEWHVMTVVFAVALAAKSAAGRAGGERNSRAYPAMAVALALVAVTLWEHGLTTWRLRERQIEICALNAMDLGGREATYVPVGAQMVQALVIRGMKLQIVPDHAVRPFPESIPDACQQALHLATAASAAGGAAVIVVDRFVRDGMPHTLDHLDRFDFLDTFAPPGPATVLRHSGHLYALRLPR